MMGNVWEMCLDSWHDNYVGAPTDGSAWEPENASANRVIRGGDWVNGSIWCLSAARNISINPGGGNGVIGFRVVAIP
jgi:formylglycine-generating enzyme required for sulfatase activity